MVLPGWTTGRQRWVFLITAAGYQESVVRQLHKLFIPGITVWFVYKEPEDGGDADGKR
jgi:hypothetical protein